MGTYSDSKFVKAKISHTCGNCGAGIYKGDEYLAYKPGQRITEKRCMKCALAQVDGGLWEGRPRYNCAVVRERLGLEPDRVQVG